MPRSLERCSSPRRIRTGSGGSVPVSSLSFHFSTSPKTLATLLSQIGWSLRRLSLHYTRKLNGARLMTAVLASCPKLTSLSINSNTMDTRRLISAYERFGGERDQRSRRFRSWRSIIVALTTGWPWHSSWGPDQSSRQAFVGISHHDSRRI